MKDIPQRKTGHAFAAQQKTAQPARLFDAAFDGMAFQVESIFAGDQRNSTLVIS
jgi:hypothetical protein